MATLLILQRVGQLYRIQTSPSLAAGSWTDFTHFTYPARIVITVPVAGNTSRFFRAVAGLARAVVGGDRRRRGEEESGRQETMNLETAVQPRMDTDSHG